jgi:predicted nucleic acid-binding protein
VAKNDRDNSLAKSILKSVPDYVMTDHVLAETCLLLNSRFGRGIAETFWDGIRRSTVHVEPVTSADLEAAWSIGGAFPDQAFSLVDRTSFAVMERLGIVKAASFDNAFVVFRYGRARDKAFEIVRSGHSGAFWLLGEAILKRKPVTLIYGGAKREVCPHIIGHTSGDERALVFQFGGSTRTKLPPEGEWRCLRVSDVRDVKVRDGPWRSGNYHRTTQRCVDGVYLDVNENVPNQPGRRALGV